MPLPTPHPTHLHTLTHHHHHRHQLCTAALQVPLDTLGNELEKHLASLSARLVEVVNEDYNDFVTLSTKLVDVDGAVARMQGPLLEFRVRV